MKIFYGHSTGTIFILQRYQEVDNGVLLALPMLNHDGVIDFSEAYEIDFDNISEEDKIKCQRIMTELRS